MQPITLEVGFDTRSETFTLPQENLMEVLTPNPFTPELTGQDAVREALAHPIGTKRVGELIHPGEKTVIITSDITRPMPSAVVLPVLLEELFAAGISPEDLTIVFALGSHRPHTEAEKIKLVGEEVYRKVRCVDSDPNDCVHMGQTKAGTPVDITRVVAQADRRICLANIEYHYFAGYSGGAKAIMPGVSTRQAIQKNHSKMVMPQASVGVVENNPVRDDLEEAIQYCPIDFILNVVLDEHKQVVKAVAGHYIQAHREGCRYLDGLYKVSIPQLADIVVVSQGGYPKDLNLYQTQKALDNAKHVVRPGGTIILVGSCKEGFGEKTFEEWMTHAKSPQELIDRIQKDFRLGGHKAAAIALVQQKAQISLVSLLPEEQVRQMSCVPYPSVQQALDEALKQYGPQAKVLVMPYGGSTLPCVETKDM